ncbi:MAG: hypothetical protein Q8R28_05770 [Dehalococcoidia bacterium]|nr:hypothetical protein [Dehalococcoidia bacterium]
MSEAKPGNLTVEIVKMRRVYFPKSRRRVLRIYHRVVEPADRKGEMLTSDLALNPWEVLSTRKRNTKNPNIYMVMMAWSYAG